MYTLRLCDLDDLPNVSDMVVEFCEDSYSHASLDLEKTLETVEFFLSDNTRTQRVVIGLYFNETLVGMLAGLRHEFLFSRDQIAQEMMWWVDKEHRNRHSLKLVEAFEVWAEKIGCKHIHMSSVQGPYMSRLSRIFLRKGYDLHEQAYVKSV